MRSPRRVVALIALAFLTAACNPFSDGGGNTPTKGGILRLGVTVLGALDPAQARSVEEVLVADQLFDSLTATHPRTSEAAPAIAARWEASPDQRQWDFFLRAGAKFSNGRPITAADVKYSLERVARRGSGLEGGDLLELVTGYQAFARDGSAPELTGITAPAPDRVHVSLDQPSALLPVMLATTSLAIVPREAVEAVAPAPLFAERPVGSGPFKVAQASANRIVLAPVSDDVLLDGIEVIRYGDLGSSYRAFEKGQIDWSRVPPERVEDAGVKYGRRGFTPYAGELLYGFNMRNPKFSDSRIRQAIMLAIDRRSVVRAIYGNTVRTLDGIVVAGIPGFQLDACGPLCTHDPDRARALLAETRPGAPPLEVFIDFDKDVTQEAVANALKTNLGAVGINAVLRPRDSEAHGKFVLSGQHELFRLGWVAAYPSPDAFLSPLFATGAPSNLTGHTSPIVDQQLRDARAQPDPVKRTEQFRAAERAVMSSLPVIPVAQLQLHAVASPRVRDVRTTPLGTFDASVVWLAPGD